MSIPILIICGCQKYKTSLIQALLRFENPVYKTIGVIGDPTCPTSFDGQILTVHTEDTYEYLPKKIHTALMWVLNNYPITQGVFKTDDDIYINDMSHFASLVKTNTNKPWWGLKIWEASEGPNEVSLSKYSDKKIKPHIGKAGLILAGAGYWLSNSILKLILNHKNFPEIR